MKKHIATYGVVAGLTALALVAVPVARVDLASAEETPTSTQERQTTGRADRESRKQAAQTRLAEAKLRTCQNREKKISTLMTRLGDRGQKQINLFSTIAERTEKFYTEKGKTLANYDALVADVAAKKSAAQMAVDAVKSTSTSFKCDGSDPKGVAASFKSNVVAQKEAIKAYKTSVKNLIVGVKSVQSTTTSAHDKGVNQ